MYYDANERLPLNNIFGEKIVKVYSLTIIYVARNFMPEPYAYRVRIG